MSHKKTVSTLTINGTGKAIEPEAFKTRKSRRATVRGYSEDGDFIRRVELHANGIYVYTGKKAGDHRKTITWEQMLEIEKSTH